MKILNKNSKFSICFNYFEGYSATQWGFVLSHWSPANIYIYGKGLKESPHGLKESIIINSAEEIPNDSGELVLLSPPKARYVPGLDSLPVFEHPEKAVYFFGSDKVHLSNELGEREPDHKVYIPTDTKHEMWSWVAAAVTLYDRMVKSG